MPTLNLQEAQVGVSLAIQIFDEFFIELHKNDDNLQSVTFQVPVIDELELVIDQIRYVYEASISSTLLQITGSVNLLNADHEVIIEIDLPLQLKPVDNAPPVLGLSYNEVHDIR